MEWQSASACAWSRNQARPSTISSIQTYTASPLYSQLKKNCISHVGVAEQTLWIQNVVKLKSKSRSRVTLRALNSNQSGKLSFSRGDISDVRVNAIDGSEPFRGKPGSVSFLGLTHQSVEENKLVSAPFEPNAGSFMWAFAPVALISSLVLPQFFIGDAIEEFFKNEVLSEIVSSFSSEVFFYTGLAMFLRVTDHVQKPYLQFSAKRWSLITGLRGYLTSAFFTMGFKIFAPLFAVYVTWPVLGLPALVSVAPFLTGCLIQYVFEKALERHGSSSWPLVPIIFEVYRLYQLTRSAHFIQKLMFLTRGPPVTPQLLERNGALVAMIVTFQILGVFCLWSLLTFLIRLFPSRPVAENY